jgi:tetratricopeptide (TPR) repeat protein
MHKAVFFTLLIGALCGCQNTKSSSLKPMSLDEAIKRYPDSVELLHQRANRSLDSMNYILLLQDAARAFRLDSNNTESRLLYALGLINKKNVGASDFTTAQYHFVKVLSKDSTNLKAMVGIAGVCANLGGNEAAFGWLNKALRINPRYRDAYVLKGSIYLRDGNYKFAKSSYETAVQQDRKFFLGYMMLGTIYQYENNPLCIEYFTTASQLQPKNTEACYSLAFAYENFNNIKEAKRFYRRMAKLDSTICESYFHLASIKQFNEGDLDSAMHWYSVALDINPKHIESLHNLGLLYEERKDRTNALLTYAKVLKINPEYSLTKDRVRALQK